MKFRNNKMKLLAILFIYFWTINSMLSISSIDNFEDNSNLTSISDPIEVENKLISSSLPSLTSSFQINDSEISPKNQDGIQDYAEFSFSTDTSADYNITIESNAEMIDYQSAFSSVVGNSSKLYMVYTNTRSYFGDESERIEVLLRTSTDMGRTWSDETDTSLYEWTSTYNKCYYNLNLIQNSSDGSLLLMQTYYNRIFPYDDDYQIRLDKSNDEGLTWNWISYGDPILSIYRTDKRYSIITDFTLSNNNSEIYSLAVTGSDEEVRFLNSKDGGITWESHNIANRYGSDLVLAPTISRQHETDNLTAIWFEHHTQSYYMSNSTDYGLSWSTPVQLDQDHGLGTIEIPYNPGQGTSDGAYERGAIEVEYDSNNNLFAYMIVNDTKIMKAVSFDGGFSWNNYSEWKSVGTANIYNLDFKIHNDDNNTLTFTGDLSGSTQPGSSYYVSPKLAINIEGFSTGNTEVKEIWNGKDENGDFLDDGSYFAKLTLINSSNGVINPSHSYVDFNIDNKIEPVIFTQENQYFSPSSSPGIKDNTKTYLTSTEEDLNYELTYELADYRTKATTRVTFNELSQFSADIAMDSSNRLHAVYVSYEENDRDLFYKYSNDFGKTFSSSISLVTGVTYDDCPTIAIHGNNIYIVFMRYREVPDSIPTVNVFDLFLLKSEDLGKTWESPYNITMGGHIGGGTANYYCPDILITNNGSIFVGYNYKQSITNTFSLIKSTDEGITFSNQINIGQQNYDGLSKALAIALTYNEEDQILYAGCANLSSIHTDEYCISISKSSDEGQSWITQGETISVSYSYVIQGITLDYVGNQELIATYYYYHSYYNEGYTYVTNSYDEGESWSYSNFFLFETLEFGGSPVSTQYYSKMRSGKTNRNDLFFIYAETPSSVGNLDIYITTYSKMVYQTTGILYKGQEQIINWDGTTFWNTIIDGEYNLNLSVSDGTGNIYEDSIKIFIDNYAPYIYYEYFEVDEWSPLDEHMIQVYNYSTIDANVDLYYRYDLGQDYTIKPMIREGIYYNGAIPGTDTSKNVYFYVNATDLAGNTVLTELKHYYDVEIVMSNDNFKYNAESSDDQRKLDDLITYTVENIDFDSIDSVFLDYKFNNASEYTTFEMQNIDGIKYSYSIQGDQQKFKLESRIRVVDIKGQTHIYNFDPITQEFIPLFPEMNLVYPKNLIIIAISAIVGIVSAIFYTYGKKSRDSSLLGKFNNQVSIFSGTSKNSIDTPSSTKNSLPTREKNKTETIKESKIIYILSLIATLSCLFFGIVEIYIIGNGGLGMVGTAVGMLFASLSLIQRLMLDISYAIHNEQKASKIPAFIHTTIIAIMLVFFMIGGQDVEWFNYYVISDVLTIGQFSMPQLWLSLFTPFITSILYIIVSSYKELSRILKRIDIMNIKGENWKIIWQQKEESISKLNSTTGLKMLVFLVTIAFTVISTTQIGRYAEFGMLLLLPFVIVWFISLLINSFLLGGQSSIDEVLGNWIIEKTKECPKCNAINLFDNIYCNNCQFKFASDTKIVSKTIECKHCLSKNPDDGEYCRKCGNELNNDSNINKNS